MKLLSEKMGNVIVCEDIRDEVGNKKSLMGVMAGDVLVPHFPATIKIAFFLEYHPDDSDEDRVSFTFRLLQDEVEIAKGNFDGPVRGKDPSMFVLPAGLIGFDKPAALSMRLLKEGQPEFEVLNKKIRLMETSS